MEFDEVFSFALKKDESARLVLALKFQEKKYFFLMEKDSKKRMSFFREEIE